MEHKELFKEPVDEQSSLDTYSIVSYSGAALPEAYRNMVFSKWLRSLKYGNDYFRLIDSDSYFEMYHQYIQALLTKTNSVVKLAVLTDDPDVVLGFAVIRDNTLDYVHVHKDQRHQGIARSLVPSNINAISHLTKIGIAIWSKHPNVKFNPFC